jgi:glycerophosphoryl diester phosphodiesterase
MRFSSILAAVLSAVGALSVLTTSALAGSTGSIESAQLGPHPFYLVDKMSDGPLKDELRHCMATKEQYKPSLFSIGHRGAGLQFPEHTKESYTAAARMGAGIVECDVTFTKDEELVCRHAQCDLHTTTDVLLHEDLRQKCTVPPEFDADGNLLNGPAVKCCTSNFTLAEFKTLKGKMDAANPNAKTVEEYVKGTANFRTDLHATGGTLMTHAESIALNKKFGVAFTPELKSVDPVIGFDGTSFNQQTYARKMIGEYIAAGIDPRKVWAQSFDINDILLWIAEFPEFGKQAVYLDGRDPAAVAANPPTVEEFAALKTQGVNIIAPPMPMLLESAAGGAIVPSPYATRAREAGLDIISWTTERSGRIVEDVLNGTQGYYYQTTLDSLENDGDILRTIDVLAQDVGIIGLFSDWPATTTFYANCKNVNVGHSNPHKGHGNGRRH